MATAFVISKLNMCSFFIDEEQDEQDFPEEDDSIAEAIPNKADQNNPGSYWHHSYFLIYLVLFYEKYITR